MKLVFLSAVILFYSLKALPAASKDLNLDLSSARGDVGIAVVDGKNKQIFMHDHQKAFPMQSVCKLPLSVAILLLCDQSKLSIQDKITVRRSDLLPYSPIKDAIKGEESDFTIRELMRRAICDSDNTSNDVLVEKAGGPQAITEILKAAGIAGIRIDRKERTMQKESRNITRFLNDLRDTATPEAIVVLLKKLYEGDLLSKESRAIILEDLFNCKTGVNRLRAGLPLNWNLAHKTGTGGDIAGKNAGTNDVGIAVGPKGQVVYVAVFIKGSRASLEAREALMAKVMEKVAGQIITQADRRSKISK